MIRLHGIVQFKDGRTEEFDTGSAALGRWERYAMRHNYPIGDDAPNILRGLVVAHAALNVQIGFDAWEETVDGVEITADGETDLLPPTLPAASIGE